MWVTEFERVPLTAASRLDAAGEYYVRVRAATVCPALLALALGPVRDVRTGGAPGYQVTSQRSSRRMLSIPPHTPVSPPRRRALDNPAS